jgi:hypothetical protein
LADGKGKWEGDIERDGRERKRRGGEEGGIANGKETEKDLVMALGDRCTPPGRY